MKKLLLGFLNFFKAGEIYCNECKYIDIEFGFMCDHPKTKDYIKTAYYKRLIRNSCEYINRNNKCKYFERREDL